MVKHHLFSNNRADGAGRDISAIRRSHEMVEDRISASQQDLPATREDKGVSDGPGATPFEAEMLNDTEAAYASMYPQTKKPFKAVFADWFANDGQLRPFRLLKQDIRNIRKRYISDWTTFNQLVFASAVYVFFTNILPGITFASDLYVLTGMTWGTIEVVFSTGLCGVIFSL